MALTILLLASLAGLGVVSSAATQNPFIVGGGPAKRGEFPWMVWFVTPSYSCDGTIINENWILTAAHCVSGEPISGYKVTAGDHRKNSREGSEQTVRVADIIVHEDYRDVEQGNDIALIRLSTPLRLGQYVKPAVLADSSTQLESNLVVAGWGRTKEGGSSSSTLLKVTIPLLDGSKCSKVYEYYPEKQICAGEQGKDSCQGDSGGPLMNLGDRTVVGIVSWGAGCGRKDYPGVYTAVGYFSSWIQDKIQ